MADVRLEGVSKSYGTHAVLTGLSLDVRHGECFTLLGPSGCGKTVLLRLIAGFEKPDGGAIRIGDRAVSNAGAGVNVPPNERDLGVVFQDYAVWPHMTVFDNVAYPLKLAQVPAAELRSRTLEAVALVNLGGLEERLPSQLSGGQQQRVALARALVARPSLMLLDEPLCNLDANLREEMRFEIKALQKRLGITILYVTHDQEIALAKQIAKFPSVIEKIVAELHPHILATYSRELADTFNTFYHYEQVLKSEGKIRDRRLTLVRAVQNTLKEALETLGIDAISTM